MEGQEVATETNEPEVVKKTEINLAKVQEICKRMREPDVEEQRFRDLRQVVRSVKDAEQITRGFKEERRTSLLAVPGKAKGRRSNVDITKERLMDLKNLTKLAGTNIKLSPEQEQAMGFLDYMAGPRMPEFDETESETSCEKISNDSDSDDNSILELFKSDDELVGKKGKVVISEPESLPKSPDRNVNKPKTKKWKPKLKSAPMKPDPMMTEFTDAIANYLKNLGIHRFMREWLGHLYGMSNRPKDPVKKLASFLHDTYLNEDDEYSFMKMESDLKSVLKREDMMKVEISKLKQLTHLLAPEIYDEEANMIVQEPSIEEEEILVEEEEESEEDHGNVEVVRTRLRGRKLSRSRTGRKTKSMKRVEKADKEDEMLGRVESKASGRSTRRKDIKRRKTGGTTRATKK